MSVRFKLCAKLVRVDRLPKEKNPQRRVMTEAQYQALLRVADTMDWRFRVALILAHETGHRRNAIRLLRWSDIAWDAETVHWRGEHEKTGYAHTTPLTPRALETLRMAQRRTAHIGDGWVLPSPRWPDKPLSVASLDRWMAEAQDAAGFPALGWHSLRRKFANELKDIPLKDLASLGGWKDPKTILQCYQAPDPERMREALAKRRPGGVGRKSTVNSTVTR